VPVTALAFSTLTPNLLAAGCADGRLSIYDVQQTQDSPILTDTYGVTIYSLYFLMRGFL
jgi:WD40 repeat protein